MVELSRTFSLTFTLMSQSYNPLKALTFRVWALPRSLATTRGITIVFFSSRYLDVSVPWVSFTWIYRLQRYGLPHSDIFGSRVVCTSPKLFAAYHVLHRLQEPRHSPCALCYFLVNVDKVIIVTRCVFYFNMSKNVSPVEAGDGNESGIEPIGYQKRQTQPWEFIISNLALPL
jgi:hypothetical protein